MSRDRKPLVVFVGQPSARCRLPDVRCRRFPRDWAPVVWEFRMAGTMDRVGVRERPVEIVRRRGCVRFCRGSKKKNLTQHKDAKEDRMVLLCLPLRLRLAWSCALRLQYRLLYRGTMGDNDLALVGRPGATARV